MSGRSATFFSGSSLPGAMLLRYYPSPGNNKNMELRKAGSHMLIKLQTKLLY